MKRIIICMDGTWQNMTVPTKRLTNVAKIAQMVAETDPRPNGQSITQLVYYSPGIGAEAYASEDADAIKQGATGAGAEEHIIAAYLHLCFNYEPGDELYMFGFSRGAFCARSLAGMIGRCGILDRDKTHLVGETFRAYRSNDKEQQELHRAQHTQGNKSSPSIEYLGLFDTVVQRGAPTQLKISAKLINKKYVFHDLKLGKHVKSARQALSIDERRNTLPPTFWSNLDELNTDAAKAASIAGDATTALDRPYQQMWFVGAHGDIGGDQDQLLSGLTLKWVLDGVRNRLNLKASPLAQSAAFADKRAFLRGQIEKLTGWLNLLGMTDRKIFPEPEDPSVDAARNAMQRVTNNMRTVLGPKEAPDFSDLLKLIHVSTVLRATDQSVPAKYLPAPLHPFKKLLNDPAIVKKLLAEREHVLD